MTNSQLEMLKLECMKAKIQFTLFTYPKTAQADFARAFDDHVVYEETPTTVKGFFFCSPEEFEKTISTLNPCWR